jgi:hypothetical protein
MELSRFYHGNLTPRQCLELVRRSLNNNGLGNFRVGSYEEIMNVAWQASHVQPPSFEKPLAASVCKSLILWCRIRPISGFDKQMFSERRFELDWGQ